MMTSYGQGSWLDRWERITGHRPIEKLHRPKKLNGLAGYRVSHSIHDDARSVSSMKFRSRKNGT